VLRLTKRVPDELLTVLTRDFADILLGGSIVQSGAREDERDEPELANLPRLVLHFDRTHFGRLRQLIDRLNREG
jgi:hypothetical protein